MYTCTTTEKGSFLFGVKQYPSPVFKKKRVIFTLNSTLPGSYFQTKFCLGDYYGAQNHATFLVIGALFVCFSPKMANPYRVHFKNLWPCICNIVNLSVYLRFYEYAQSLACAFTKSQCSGGGELPFWRCRICRAIKTSVFQHHCHPMTPYFFFSNQWLSLKDPLFFLSICHRKPVTFQFQQQIGYFKWFFAQSSLSKVRNSILGISMGLKWFSPKDPKITFLPNVPIKKMQNAVSHQKTPYFSVLLSPDAPGCENRCPIPISISYIVPRIMPFFCASVSK